MCEHSFQSLKAILSAHPVLKSPSVTQPFSLYVDASDVAVGAMLSQHDSVGIEHPVAYYSEKLNKHQKRYSTIEKEALALLLSLRHFEVFTDHNPLVFVSKFRNKNRKLSGWHLCLQEYNLNIHHIAGRNNVVVDILSR
jgi:hypothetical protein